MKTVEVGQGNNCMRNNYIGSYRQNLETIGSCKSVIRTITKRHDIHTIARYSNRLNLSHFHGMMVYWN